MHRITLESYYDEKETTELNSYRRVSIEFPSDLTADDFIVVLSHIMLAEGYTMETVKEYFAEGVVF